MGLFSRKKPQLQGPLPPVPRFSSPGQQPFPPTYEPEFSHSQQQPEFPMLQPEPVQLPPLPEAPSFPRPLPEQPSEQPRPLDERFQQTQQPLERPIDMPVSRPEPVRIQPQPVQPRAAPVEIPVREPSFLRKPAQYPDREAVANQRAFPWQRQEQAPLVSIPERPLPPPMSPPQAVARAPISFSSPPLSDGGVLRMEDKPLFVKIGQYREAMSHLELLKQKVKEAETVLTRLEELRAKEQAEITNARTMLQTVKERLLAIDKQLFEV